MDVDAVFRPGVDTPSSTRAINDLEMRESAEDTNLFGDEEDRRIRHSQFSSLRDKPDPYVA